MFSQYPFFFIIKQCYLFVLQPNLYYADTHRLLPINIMVIATRNTLNLVYIFIILISVVTQYQEVYYYYYTPIFLYCLLSLHAWSQLLICIYDEHAVLQKIISSGKSSLVKIDIQHELQNVYTQEYNNMQYSNYYMSHRKQLM